MSNNKVKFNIHDVHYATITQSGTTVTFGTPVKIEGAKAISLEPNNDANEIYYADGLEYYVQSSATGYEGDLEMALIPDSFRAAIYGETEDTAHDLWENINAEAKKFALGFVIDGDQQNTYYWFQNCSATKPAVDSATNEASKTVGTEKITIKCSPDANGNIRVKSTSSSTVTNWFTAVKSAPSTT